MSLSRHNFESRFNAATNTQESAEMSFPDFIYVVLEGAMEYAEFLQENSIEGESIAVDTGAIDGTTGVSKGWNPIWRQCSVCHPYFQPHYIMHMQHFTEDAKVHEILILIQKGFSVDGN